MALFFNPAFQERLVILGAVLLRVLVGLSSYSGAGHPPKYGDYEAQRHWMEITTNMPPREWYTESKYNSIAYWPLDYPPLSGYQSWVHGHLLKHYEPAAVAFGVSWGYETPTSKRLMRATVLLSDLLIFFPLALAASRALYGPRPSSRRAFTLAATLLNPALIIIDHGHFQYNCISLGLAIGGAAAIAVGRQLLGSFLFCCALNHKQMALYYAPAFFAHLLGKSLARRGFANKIWGVIRLGMIVIASFALAWAPWLTSQEDVMRVVHRIFPLRRGLFEDYVGNWWCTSSVVIKWKQIIAPERMVLISAVATLVAATPSMIHQIWRPSSRGLVVAMANSAAAFFMLAFQVHEKSVLLPLTPVLLLAGDYPAVAAWMPLVSMASMYPLLERDGLTLPYFALWVIWGSLMLAWAPRIQSELATAKFGLQSGADGGGGSDKRGRRGGRGVIGVFLWLLGLAFVVAVVACHVAQVTVPPPEHLPWLYDRVFITIGFAGLALSMLYLQISQWRLPPQVTYKWSEQEETQRKKDL